MIRERTAWGRVPSGPFSASPPDDEACDLGHHGEMTIEITSAQARRIALAAQGFGRPAPVEPGTRQINDLVRRLGVVQIDSVNVVSRTHYLPLFSRLGAYDRGLLERAAWGPGKRSLFEYWGHEASFLPVESQPLLRWRMARARDGELWTGLARFGRERRDYVDGVLAEIERRGPVTGADFAAGPRGKPGWWEWSDGKRALEWLFWSGFITTRTRRGFERVYDLTERVLPAAVADAPTPDDAEAQRGLILIAARAMGIATAADLRDYFRLSLEDSRAMLAELVEAGALIPVTVRGWSKPAYLHLEARRPRRIEASALLSPFDNLIWFRDRTERLFGVRVRLEIYTPAHKRERGYYVLPFLQDEAITACVDLKADRQNRTLLVQAAWTEPEADAETPVRLAIELRRMAAWLELDRVTVVGRGDLAPALADALLNSACA
jgi:uncharacterized protein YcaQ